MHAQDTSRLYLGNENPNLIINNQGVELKFNFDLGAKGFSNATMVDFNQKNPISDERKKNILKQLYPTSHVGYDLSTSLAYKLKIKSNLFLWFELGSKSHAHAFLKKNLLELALNGNSYYAGKDIDLEGNKYTGISWQYFTTGQCSLT
ncbi:MAG: hypothetical protein HYZ42_02690 [Bacteroidetes bacterium]|nr:hypothetical protein [Bacteroidota bacterium]